MMPARDGLDEVGVVLAIISVDEVEDRSAELSATG